VAERTVAVLHLKQLVALPDAELAGFDVALVNLACAADLPGAGLVDREGCLATLDWWAGCVRQYTERYLPKFRADPARYQGSEAYYRCLALVTVLQRDLGVRYNPAKAADGVPFDAADSFIHGIVQGGGGTCATMPVVYAAVGRRLGYPVRLVKTRRHLFARWDDPRGERLNIEGTNKGLSCPPDDHYRTGSFRFDPALERPFGYLVSMTPRMELATFLAGRGRLLFELSRYGGAADAFAWASALVPENKLYRACVQDVLEAWADRLGALRTPGLPRVGGCFPGQRRYPPAVPVLVERRIIFYEQAERALGEAPLLARAGAGGGVRWELTGSLGSVRDVVSAAGTTVPDHVEYGGFGTTAWEMNLGSGGSILYTGLRQDRGTGIVWADNRTLFPATGQWMEEDPIQFQAGDANLRGYVSDDPTNYTDPTGLAALQAPGRVKITNVELLQEGTFETLDKKFADKNGPISSAGMGWSDAYQTQQLALKPPDRFVDPKDKNKYWNPKLTDFSKIDLISGNGNKRLIGATFVVLITVDESPATGQVTEVSVVESAKQSYYLGEKLGWRIDNSPDGTYTDRPNVKADRASMLKQNSNLLLATLKGSAANVHTIVFMDSPHYPINTGASPMREVKAAILIKDSKGNQSTVTYTFSLGVDIGKRDKPVKFTISKPTVQ
jgi:RHS repeat-associated protein